MIPVFQTKYGEGKGNCFQAAIASIMELELEKVPDFANQYKDDGRWWEEYNKWLDQFGLEAVTITFSQEGLSKVSKNAYFLVSGPSKANGVGHCVVYQGDKLAHDPHKGWNGIIPEVIDLIFSKDPSVTLNKIKEQ